MATQSTTDQVLQISGSESIDDLKWDITEEIIPGGQYKLEHMLREENHATVYSISSIMASDASPDELEARTYVIEGIPDELRKYRLRNIKRLSSRTVLKVPWNGLIVVVYKVASMKIESYKDGMLVKIGSEVERQSDKRQQTKARGKSDLQREKDRLRQSERRKNRRKQERLKAGCDENRSEAVEQVFQETTDEEEVLYLLLHLAYNRRPELRQQLPLPSRIQLENYLQKQPLQFEDASEMENFMEVKLREVVFLGQQEKRLPNVEKRRKEEYADLLIQQISLPKGSEAYKLMHDRCIMAQGKLRVVQNAQKVLPKVIAGAEKVYRDMKRAVKLVHDLQEEKEQLQALSDDWRRLNRKVAFCEKVSKEVVPGSEPYAHAMSNLQVAEEELRLFNHRGDETTIAMLELSKEQTETLLAGLMKDLDITGAT
jgi:hypothetical protein